MLLCCALSCVCVFAFVDEHVSGVLKSALEFDAWLPNEKATVCISVVPCGMCSEFRCPPVRTSPPALRDLRLLCQLTRPAGPLNRGGPLVDIDTILYERCGTR